MKKIYSIVFLVVLHFNMLATRSTTYQATNLQVYRIAIDDQGNVWYAKKDGLTKFDGNNWTIYQYDSRIHSDSVSVYSPMLYAKGDIWLAIGSVLWKFDGAKWTIYDRSNGYLNSYPSNIKTDNHNNIWIAARNGVSKFDGKNWTNYYKNLVQKFDGKDWITDTLSTELSNNDRIYDVAVDLNGNIWCGGNYISKFDGTSWTNTPVPPCEWTGSGYHAPNRVNSIVVDSTNNIWFSFYYSDVRKFDGVSWTNYTDFHASKIAVDKHNNKWFGSNRLTKFNDTIWTEIAINACSSYDMVMDKDENIWIACGSILKYDHGNCKIYKTSYGLASNQINNIFIDKDGNKWFATDNGVSKFDSINWIRFDLYHGLPHNNVSKITQDKEGNMWFGTIGGGIAKFDGANWYIYNKSNGLASDSISDIAVAANNNIWIATNTKGVAKFDGINWIHYNKSDGLASDSVNCIAIDSIGSVWFGTNGRGVSKFDGINWMTFNTSNGLVDNRIRAISIDKNNNKWVVFSYSDQFSKFNDTICTNGSTFGGLSGYLLSVIIDKQGTKWFTNRDGGLLLLSDYNWSTENYYLSGEPLVTIAIDKYNIKWVGCRNGVIRFDSSPSFLNLSVDTIFLGATGGSSGTFSIISNTDWSCGRSGTKDQWLSLNKNRSFGNDTITVKVQQNAYSVRKGTIIVSYPYTVKQIFVIQEANGQPFLDISDTTVNMEAARIQNKRISITSNALWKITCNNSWLRLNGLDSQIIQGMNNDYFYLYVEANPLKTTRTGTVTISTRNGSFRTITVNQPPATMFSLSKDTIWFDHNGNNKDTVKIISDTNYKISYDKSWLWYSVLGSPGNDALVIRVDSSNTDTVSRVATVTVDAVGFTPLKITVIQQVLQPKLSISEDTLWLESNNSSGHVNITSNTVWTTSCDQSWVNIYPRNGSFNGILTLSLIANEDTVDRWATVKLLTNGEISDILTIIQNAGTNTNIGDLLNSNFVLYPNPVANKLYINFGMPISKATAKIYSLSGKLIYSSSFNKSQLEIDMQKFSPGLYLIKIITSNTIMVSKIVKQ